MSDKNQKQKDDEYLIWSIEHGAWWRPASRGYTPYRECAGRYSREEAVAVCSGWGNFKDVPNEAMILVTERN